MAFPPPATRSPSQSAGGSVVRLEQEPETDDAGEPDEADADRDAVEVALGHRRPAETAGHPASEHVGQAAPTALVQQHEQDHQHAADDEQDLENGDHAGILTDALLNETVGGQRTGMS